MVLMSTGNKMTKSVYKCWGLIWFSECGLQKIIKIKITFLQSYFQQHLRTSTSFVFIFSQAKIDEDEAELANVDYANESLPRWLNVTLSIWCDISVSLQKPNSIYISGNTEICFSENNSISTAIHNTSKLDFALT